MDRGKTKLASLGLCGVFAVLAIGVALLTGGVYQRCAERADRNYACRTALSYVTNQLRRGDRAGAVSLARLEDRTALRIDQEEGYALWLYCWDGAFRELYAAVDGDFGPSDGEALFSMEAFDVDLEGSRVSFTLTDGDGTAYSARLWLRCGEGAA